MNEVSVNKMRFQLDLSQPLYEQVLNQVRSMIAKGEVELGDKMPSVRELAQVLQINPNTVMRAYQELERDGLTETRRGQGTFITGDPRKVVKVRTGLAEAAVDEFLTRMSDLGYRLEDIVTIIQTKGSEER